MRHPLPITGHIEKLLSLTFAFPEETLTPLLSPGLALDTVDNFGFISWVTFHTRNLRPSFLPGFLGRDYFLTSYRLFTRYKQLRGLQILRNDTNSPWLVNWGNRITGFGYRYADIDFTNNRESIRLDVKTANSESDANVSVDVSTISVPLPPGSPFADLESAREFAGPLPLTFDYHSGSHSMFVIEGRSLPIGFQPVRAIVHRSSFLKSSPFSEVRPILAAAFYAQSIPYRWGRGRKQRPG